MSGRGGRSRVGLVAAVPHAKPAGVVKPSPSLLTPATRVSGRSPARGAAQLATPARGGSAQPPVVRGRAAVRGSSGAAVTRGASLGQSPRGSPVRGGGGSRASPKPPPAVTAAATKSKGGGPGKAESVTVPKEPKGISPSESIIGLLSTAATETVNASATEGLDLKLSDFPGTPSSLKSTETAHLDDKFSGAAAAVAHSPTLKEETVAVVTSPPAPTRRRRVFPKLNENPEAPEVLDVENMKSSMTTGQAVASSPAAGGRKQQRLDVAAAAVTPDSSDSHHRVGGPMKNGSGPFAEEEDGGGRTTNGEAATAETTNGYSQSLVETEDDEGGAVRRKTDHVAASPLKTKTEVKAIIQVAFGNFQFSGIGEGAWWG